MRGERLLGWGRIEVDAWVLEYGDGEGEFNPGGMGGRGCLKVREGVGEMGLAGGWGFGMEVKARVEQKQTKLVCPH